MIIAENNLRKLIYQELISESFMTTKVDSLEAVSIDGKKYNALGYSMLDKESSRYSIENILNLVTGAQDRLDTVILQVPSNDAILTKIKGSKFILLDGEILIRNSGTKFKFNTDVFNKNNKSKTRIVAFPIGEAIRKKHKVKFSSERLDFDAPSGADYAIEIAGILGMIPGLGEPLDAASAVLAIAKDPPDYILAIFSILCAVPVVGTAIALLRPGVKKIAQEGGEEASKKFVEYIVENVDANFDKATVRKMSIHGRKVFDVIENTEAVEHAANITGVTESVARENLEETRKIFDKIMEGFEDIGAARGGRPLASGTKEAIEKQTKEQLDVVVKSLKRGKLRELARENLQDLALLLARKENEFREAYLKAVRDSFDSADAMGIYQDSLRFLNDYGDELVGKKFTLPDPPGGSLIYKSYDDFRDSLYQMCKLHGLGLMDVLAPSIVNTVRAATFRFPSERDVDQLIDKTIDMMSNVKYKAVSDMDIAARPKSAGGLGLRTGRPDESVITFGFATGGGTEVVINTSAFEGQSAIGRPLEQMRETIQEEFLHSADELMISALSMGDEFVKQLLKKADIAAASDKLAQNAFNPTEIPDLVLATGAKAFNLNFLNRLDTKEKFAEYFLKTSDGPVVEANVFYPARAAEAAQKLFENARIPKFHSHIIITYLTERIEVSSLSTLKETLDSMINYHGNSMEFFAKMENLKYAIVKAGVEDPNKITLNEFVNFLKKYDSYRELGNDVPKIKNNPFFKAMWEILATRFSSEKARDEILAVVIQYL